MAKRTKKVGTLIASNHTFSITCELAREDVMVASDGVWDNAQLAFSASCGWWKPCLSVLFFFVRMLSVSIDHSFRWS